MTIKSKPQRSNIWILGFLTYGAALGLLGLITYHRTQLMNNTSRQTKLLTMIQSALQEQDYMTARKIADDYEKNGYQLPNSDLEATLYPERRLRAQLTDIDQALRSQPQAIPLLEIRKRLLQALQQISEANRLQDTINRLDPNAR